MTAAAARRPRPARVRTDPGEVPEQQVVAVVAEHRVGSGAAEDDVVAAAALEYIPGPGVSGRSDGRVAGEQQVERMKFTSAPTTAAVIGFARSTVAGSPPNTTSKPAAPGRSKCTRPSSPKIWSLAEPPVIVSKPSSPNTSTWQAEAPPLIVSSPSSPWTTSRRARATVRRVDGDGVVAAAGEQRW